VAAAAAPPTGIIDCQSHLFFPEVLDMMRKRKTEPLVYDDKGTVFLKMGDWLRKVPMHYLDVNAKLASMDASGIEITMLSTNDPGPEWFGADGPAVAQLIHDSIAGVIAQHPMRFRGLCVLPLQNETAAGEYLRSIYMDIVSPLPEAMRFALDFSSADKLLFSSDHAWVEPKEILDPLRSLKLPAADEQKSSQAMRGGSLFWYE